MDSSQITGATSSYARKYALNGLFNIDDTKDADTDAYANQTNYKNKKQQSQPKSQQTPAKKEEITRESMLEYLVAMYKEYKENVAMYIKPLLKANNVKVVSDLNNEQLTTLYTAVKSNEKGIKGL
jgi:FtsZ-interacting cell division protein YlmF